MLKKESYRRYLGKFGKGLPFPVKCSLAQFSKRFSYLFLEDGEVIYDRFLGDLRVSVDARRNIEREMLTGTYDPPIQNAIRRFLPEGGVAIDVGANVGAIALGMAKQVGSAGKVYAFEPGPELAARLERNLSLNPGLRHVVELIRQGVADQVGELAWAESTTHPGNAGFGKMGIPVPVTTLEAFVAARQINRLDFLKVDTEGMELAVLQGAVKVLQYLRPVIVVETFMEFEQFAGSQIRKFLEDLLLGFNYELYDLPKGLSDPLHPVRHPHFRGDTLAIPKSS